MRAVVNCNSLFACLAGFCRVNNQPHLFRAISQIDVDKNKHLLNKISNTTRKLYIKMD